MDKWLPAIWMIANDKNGISSYEVARGLGVTQKSAWFMLHRIRLAMQTGTFQKLAGEVEVDETFIGGKAIVMGILERNGDTHTAVIPDREQYTLQPMVRDHIEAGAELYTDAHAGYTGLDTDYLHSVIDHAVAYAEGKIHTNGMENFWALLKRGINGTYVSIEPFHLESYLDEQAYRFNHRKETDAERFVGTFEGVIGRRLTHDDLTGRLGTDALVADRQGRGQRQPKDHDEDGRENTGADTIPAV